MSLARYTEQQKRLLFFAQAMAEESLTMQAKPCQGKAKRP